jgi:hypothetical protein
MQDDGRELEVVCGHWRKVWRGEELENLLNAVAYGGLVVALFVPLALFAWFTR